MSRSRIMTIKKKKERKKLVVDDLTLTFSHLYGCERCVPLNDSSPGNLERSKSKLVRLHRARRRV